MRRTTQQIVPIIIPLVPRKNSETYSELFTVLKHIRWIPHTITVDFEAAAIKELKTFPSVNIFGCNFHFIQCLGRLIQSLRLFRDCKEDEKIRFHIVRMCATLEHLPERDMYDVWLFIQETSP
ncbi:hypothetical protein AVEN_183406-1 [Araneus ventricosus]|uniref:MULE transposase domain-containing protein n=1 Tax=Araneus ventricosus TaxID=182803 RepID=A0A4Y2A6V0_ARAVE|nr:hypothetical protein AVEN_183406-1 [Araneus ventricosus]